MIEQKKGPNERSNNSYGLLYIRLASFTILTEPDFFSHIQGLNGRFIVATLLTRTENDVLIAYFQDVRIIDESRIQSLGQELNDLVTGSETKKVVLNFQNVSFMSSAMIGKLIQFGKKCKSSDVKLRLCNINDNVEEVFNLMKLEKVFKIDKNEEASVAGFNKKGWFG